MRVYISQEVISFTLDERQESCVPWDTDNSFRTEMRTWPKHNEDTYHTLKSEEQYMWEIVLNK